MTRTVGAFLISQFEALAERADHRMAPRHRRMIQAHFGKLATANHGHVGETENLPGECAGSDDQTGHGDGLGCCGLKFGINHCVAG